MSLPADFLRAFERLCDAHGLDPAMAADELAADYAFDSVEHSRAWVLMSSGRRLDLLNPSPMDLEEEDIVEGQAAVVRWGGSTNGDHPIVDAQHAVNVLASARDASANGLDPWLELAILLHDASEGPLCFDPISPLKPFLGAGYRRLDRRLQAAIHVRVGLPGSLPPGWKEIIKTHDSRVAASEALYMTPWTPDQVRRSLGIKVAPMETDRVGRANGLDPWRPWPKAVAREIFAAEFDRVLARARQTPRTWQ